MGLDIRIPIGLMFSIFGVIITLYGFFTKANTELYNRSLHVNINIWMGVIMLVFGIFMLLLVKLAKKPKE
jgi:uncharacterized membrane protein YidH (DUF202 family)